jgi:hypothetical protein
MERKVKYMIDDDTNNQDPNFLSLSARYLGAWQEYNTRIMARHSITQMWLTSTAVLIAAIFSGEFTALAKLAAFSIPLFSLVHAMLIFMHDEMMGNLHHFMIRCETTSSGIKTKNNKKKKARMDILSYHSGIEWADYLVKRKIQNYSFAFISFITSSAALSKATQHDIFTPIEYITYSVIILCNITLYVLAIKRRLEKVHKQK